jgi:hypothetical protein
MDRKKRSNIVGQYGEQIAKERYERQGYRVTSHPINQNGIDLVAENETEVIFLEVINWKKSNYLSMQLLKGYEEHFKDVEGKYSKDKRQKRRRLVYSFRENLEFFIDYLYVLDVELDCQDEQYLPPELEDEQTDDTEGFD